jgi:hypothetical protein
MVVIVSSKIYIGEFPWYIYGFGITTSLASEST